MTSRDSKDDRGDAPGWYVAYLVRRRMGDMGHKQTDVCQATGVPSSALTNCLARGHSMGYSQLYRIAPYLGTTAGQIVDDAVVWWDRKGREEAKEFRRRAAGVEKPGELPWPMDVDVGSSTPPPGSTSRPTNPPKSATG